MIHAPIGPIIEQPDKDDVLYRTLEIQMQRLGHLVPYREQLNWSTHYTDCLLGDHDALKKLQKMAAKNDRTWAFYAKWTGKTVYQHVLCHPNDRDLYLPFRFESPFCIIHDNRKMWVGSAPRLLEELKWLEISIKAAGTEDVRAFWEAFQNAARQAVQSVSAMTLQRRSED